MQVIPLSFFEPVMKILPFSNVFAETPHGVFNHCHFQNRFHKSFRVNRRVKWHEFVELSFEIGKGSLRSSRRSGSGPLVTELCKASLAASE